MEGRTKTGDIDNICGGRFGGLLFCSGNFAMFAAIRRASSLPSSSAVARQTTAAGSGESLPKPDLKS